MTGFSSEQTGVLSGMVSGLVVPPFVIAGMAWLLPARLAVEASFAWIAVAAIPLVACIGFIASHRFRNPAAIGGQNPAGDTSLAAARAVLQNTLEQTVLFAMAVGALQTSVPQAFASVPLAMAFWFVIARATFAVFYRKGAAARSFGFAASFYPTVLALVGAMGSSFF